MPVPHPIFDLVIRQACGIDAILRKFPKLAESPLGPVSPPVDEREILEACADSIRKDLTRLDVLKALSDEQQHELAVIIAQLSKRFIIWRLARQLRRIMESPGRTRKFARKAARTRKALDDLAAMSKTFGFQPDHDDVVTRIRKDFTFLQHHVGEMRLNLPSRPINPKSGATDALTQFFTSCGIGQNDASVRTARIGNEWWGWKIKEHDASSATPHRSDAIRKRLNRRRKRQQPARDVSRKTR